MLQRFSKAKHGGNLQAASLRWGRSPAEYLDFSASINPLGPSARVKESIHRALAAIDHYPEPEGEGLKRELAQYLGIDNINLVLGNGAAELIYLIGRMFGQERILLLAPCFAEYGAGIDKPVLKRIGLNAEDSFQLPVEELSKNISNRDLLFIANPNNPTGNLFAKEDLLIILQKAMQKDAMLIVDEAFIDFVGDDTHSLRFLACRTQNLIVIGSMTKFFALPGLRLGYAVATAENIARMEYYLPPWRINNLALAAGQACIEDMEYISETLELIKKERENLTRGLQGIGFKVYPGEANYLLVCIEDQAITAQAMQEKLGPEGIVIRTADSFHNLSAYHFRLAVRSQEDNKHLINTIKKVMA
ncbi:l-threonine 3-o-phosphate decarboxylase [hydrocarbon metagenome]|uniref:threonine-phosphate decarboxylase n=1 Tax=hydrocarbon metagenome TaxID=938273 RepID=A0A0W8EAI2_9ZZZZ